MLLRATKKWKTWHFVMSIFSHFAFYAGKCTRIAFHSSWPFAHRGKRTVDVQHEKPKCELTYKSSNSLLIYFISCLHAILFVLKHFRLAFVVTREVLIRTFVRSIDAPFSVSAAFCGVIIAAAFFGLLHSAFNRGVCLTLHGYAVIWFVRSISGCHVLFSMQSNVGHFPTPFTPTPWGRSKIFCAYKSMAF